MPAGSPARGTGPPEATDFLGKNLPWNVPQDPVKPLHQARNERHIKITYVNGKPAFLDCRRISEMVC